MDSGIIVINKPIGYTSHDCIAIMRGVTGIRKMGHTGTLDPNAAGVLPICFGKATKLIEYMDTASKTYVAGIKFGIVTETQDIWGEEDESELPLSKRSSVPRSASEIEPYLEPFRGEIDQVPPAYSAVFVNGRRAYDIARSGGKPELKARRITVYSLDLLDYDPETSEGHIQVTCSRGTYVRTICHDIGMSMGCGACLSSLVRTEACGFKIEEALDLERARELTSEEVLSSARPVEDALGSMQRIDLPEEMSKTYLNGMTLKFSSEGYAQKEPTVVYCGGKLLGISSFINDSLKPLKVFS